MAAGWFAAGKTLGVALDLGSGNLRVSVDGGEWAVAFPEGCAPSGSVGAALFPALSGCDGVRARCNWGTDAARPMKFAPPSGEYMAVGLAYKVMQCRLLCSACPLTESAEWAPERGLSSCSCGASVMIGVQSLYRSPPMGPDHF